MCIGDTYHWAKSNDEALTMPPLPSPSAPRKALELDGSRVGVIASAAGGDAYADVIIEAAPSGFPRKHLSAVRYRDIVIEFGQNLSAGFSSWLAAIPTSATPILKDGAIITFDAAGSEQGRLKFAQARVVELALPALDTSTPGPALARVKLLPQSTLEVGSSGYPVAELAPPGQDAWGTSNFRVRLAGLEQDSKYVTRVEAMTIARPRVGVPTIGDLVVSVPAAHSQGFRAWHRDFVVAGHNDQTYEKSGSIELLSPNFSETLLTVTLGYLGIHSLTHAAPTGGSSAERLVASMYCEQLGVTFGSPSP
jgi:hypothetical protein